jgi:hypothetical protein
MVCVGWGRDLGPRCDMRLTLNIFIVVFDYFLRVISDVLQSTVVSAQSQWVDDPSRPTRTRRRTGHREPRTETDAGAATVGSLMHFRLRLLSMQHVSRACPRPRPAPTANGERPIPRGDLGGDKN